MLPAAVVSDAASAAVPTPSKGCAMLYIGIDLGTSAVKLLLMDGEGSIKNIVSKEYPLEFPRPGWSQARSGERMRGDSAGRIRHNCHIIQGGSV